MHMKNTGIWKKLTAMAIAAIMILSALPAAFAITPEEWADVRDNLKITLNWTGDDAPERIGL